MNKNTNTILKLRVGQIETAIHDVVKKFNGYVNKDNYKQMEIKIVEKLIEYDKINALGFDTELKKGFDSL